MTFTGPDGTETTELTTKAELEAEEMYTIIEFKTDGTFYADDEQDGTWTQSGSTVTISDSEGESATITVDGNVLKYSDSETEGDYSYTMEMRFTKI